jgi:hypothetical protein
LGFGLEAVAQRSHQWEVNARLSCLFLADYLAVRQRHLDTLSRRKVGAALGLGVSVGSINEY